MPHFLQLADFYVIAVQKIGSNVKRITYIYIHIYIYNSNIVTMADISAPASYSESTLENNKCRGV